MTLEEWIGKNAFGLGCQIATIIKKGAADPNVVEPMLREIFIAIRQWYEIKESQVEK